MMSMISPSSFECSTTILSPTWYFIISPLFYKSLFENFYKFTILQRDILLCRSQCGPGKLAFLVAICKVNNKPKHEPACEPCPVSRGHSGKQIQTCCEPEQWNQRVFFYKRHNADEHTNDPE